MTRYTTIIPSLALGAALLFAPGGAALAAAAGGGSSSHHTEDCTNGKDDDGDGNVDCADNDCRQSPACTEAEIGDLCRDGVDNDGDGNTDCDDPQCQDSNLCASDVCVAPGDVQVVFYLAIELPGGKLAGVRCTKQKEDVKCDSDRIGPNGRPLLKLGPPMCGGAR